MEFVRLSPLGLATLVVGMLLGHVVSLADELPKDTNKIESLTPEQAQKLAKEFLGTQAEFKIESGFGFGWGKVPVSNCLPLNGLKSLDVETAKALVSYRKGPLLLNGLITLDVPTAKALAGFTGQRLFLAGLTTLDADIAKALAEFEGKALYLNGLTTLNADTARLLAQFKAQWLYLDGLTTLDTNTAKAIAGFKGCKGVSGLSLDGLTTLDTETARALAGLKGREMSFNGLTMLDTATAKAIAGFKGAGLDLNGLTTLDAKTAEALSDFKGGGLRLDGLTTLNADTAKALAGFWRTLYLNGLTTLDTDTAKALAQFKGNCLYLNGLTTLDTETAKALAELKGGLRLPVAVRESFFMANLTPETALRLAALFHGDLSFVTALDSPDSVAIAKVLATLEGPLKLPNLKKISPKTLTALIKKEGEDVEIPLIETLELIPEPDGSVTEDFMIPEGFEMRQRVKEQ